MIEVLLYPPFTTIDFDTTTNGIYIAFHFHCDTILFVFGGGRHSSTHCLSVEDIPDCYSDLISANHIISFTVLSIGSCGGGKELFNSIQQFENGDNTPV